MKYQSFILLAFLCVGVWSCTPKWERALKKQKIEMPGTQAEKDKNIILDYVLKNKLKGEFTDSGIYYFMTEDGAGDKPSANAQVTAHYKGYLLDGTKFDSSYDRQDPLKFGLNQVIKGWQEAIPMLKKGGKGTFLIPSGLAYGERGAGAVIPPNAVLAFDIELVDF